MFMIDLPLDAARLLRFAHHQGHRQSAGEDFGYAAHAWLSATLGDRAPRPFRLLENRNGLRMLGYASHPIEELSDHAQLFAEPNALAVCQWAEAASKAMPDHWQSGQRLGFEARACPISRAERERDVYLIAISRAEVDGTEAPSRPQVYVEWLRRQLAKDGAAQLAKDGTADSPAQAIDLIGFQRVRSRRIDRASGSHKPRSIERPDALFSGELTIDDSGAFARLLARGIGRHRAFGFGMLLLRPPRQTR